MIKIYGIASSRALRPLWLLEEIGMEYEHIPVDFRKKENLEPEYLAINPNGKIPTLIDEDLTLYESMAINLYLAKQYGGDLYPDNPKDEARANMWSYWVMTEVEHALLTVLLHSRVLDKTKRDPAKIRKSLHALEKPFTVLDQALDGADYLINNRFGIADINVAAVFSWCRPARVDLEPWPQLKAWLECCVGRPAFKTAIRR